MSRLIFIQWYDPDAVTTSNGSLIIKFDHFPNHGVEFRSGMIQSWNKLCFKGGLVEISVSLPGAANVSGLWPSVWMMGNLGRPGYPATTDGLWPYTYWDQCDLGILQGEGFHEGRSSLPGMRLPACTCRGDSELVHPSPGKSRSAPEIDVIEASFSHFSGSGDDPQASASQSVQFAPFDPNQEPDYGNLLLVTFRL